MKKDRFFKFFVFVVIFFNLNSIFSQNFAFTSQESMALSATGARSANAGFAEEEFRMGVQSYYRGSYNDAILQFEKALSYLPSENIIIDWLGKAYYRAGLEGTALAQWKLASDNGYGGLLLQNKIEIVRERRINDNSDENTFKYTESGTYKGNSSDGKNLIFSQPVSLLPNPDGSVWLVAYGSNELLRMDINGFVYERSNGSLTGFDRPMDIIRLNDGNLLVSEFAGDRLSLFNSKGRFLKSFGKKGAGIGNIIGPQYLATDDSGNIYVSDFGNSRINVFDKEGTGLFFFGSSRLKAPTGIAIVDSTVFVADCVTGAIYKFDTSGNYLGLLCREKTFVHPEAIKKWGNFLVICDKNKIYSIDVSTGTIFENANTGNAPSKLTCCVPDVNGNLLASDYLTNEIYVMAKMSELVGGLFVQIERVNSQKFPEITLEVKVENRHRQGLVGLKEQNFVVTEKKGAVQNYRFLGAAYANDFADITFIIDRSLETENYSQAIESAVREIASAMKNKGTVRLVSAGRVPVQEYEGAPSGLEKFSLKSVKNPLTANYSIDGAIRLAANSLINAQPKRAIILIGTGNVGANSFERYNLTDLTSYLNNNSISFSTVSVSNSATSKEISYICEHTEGKSYYVYQSRGLSPVIEDIINIPNGIYMLSYTSSQSKAFGEKYLPVEVETYLMNRSGRDDSGYFAPLE
ncbi:hypothetical protein [Treponema pectinovorum]|uniref:hypothetical protein n=1 Tax=Treponema pectinovorum TaxID=164 RepID=UPI0011C9E901|nr:hypothetical protein [Treponema pectinovorum]